MAKSNLVSKALCYERFTCGICLESLPFSKKFRIKNKKKRSQSQCSSHPFCCDCISRYIKVKVEHNNTSEIKCPDAKCVMILDPLSCRSILSKKLFVRWCRILCESVVQSLGSHSRGKSHAYCPYKNCSELILNECGLSSSPTTREKCPNCKNLFCFQCQVPWRENHPCNIMNKDSRETQFFELVIKNNWRCCPTCNQYIERIDGCTFIMCRCKTKFCYFCGSKVTKKKLCDCGRSDWDLYHEGLNVQAQQPTANLTDRDANIFLKLASLLVVICVIGFIMFCIATILKF